MGQFLAGKNDLVTTNPELAKQAYGWDPSKISAGSHKKLTWKCSNGHLWEARPNDRTGKNKNNCPICANKKLLTGYNDLKTLHPEIAKEADGWDPSKVLAGSSKKVSWKCSHGHKWNTSLIERSGIHKTKCPFCMNQKVWKGFNDLKTLFPKVAKQAYGWDPSKVLAKSNKKLSWKCEKNHIWEIRPNDRTGKNKNNCPFCANKKLLTGFNDLKTLHPAIAKEADGWDPSKVLAGSHKRVSWKCEKNHKWSTQLVQRSSQNTGCPFCSNQKLLIGFNDLKTLYPEIAKEADGWDASKVIAGGKKKLDWKCTKGHKWKSDVYNRITRESGCPICANKQVWKGFNDLKTLYPEVAKEADGWDPSLILSGSNKKLPWKCKLGHVWKSAIYTRTNENRKKTECPFCMNQKVWKGFNDLKTLHPEIAKEADGWDPSLILSRSNKRLPWKCKEGHLWRTRVFERTKQQGTGCPECAESGFDPGKPAWFYLMRRENEQQIGITNNINQRIKFHRQKGWEKVDVVGPYLGKTVLNTETEIKRWIKSNIGLVPGKTENWYINKLEIKSLNELNEKCGLSAEIFN